jgi:hypothetical protein
LQPIEGRSAFAAPNNAPARGMLPRRRRVARHTFRSLVPYDQLIRCLFDQGDDIRPVNADHGQHADLLAASSS